MSTLLRTPLFDWHVAAKARIVPFAGWDMPVQYSGVIAEHKAVRSNLGLFDVGHMARFHFDGKDALPLLEKMFTNSVAGMKHNQVRYGLVCNAAGGILDDVLVYRWANNFSMVANASNREKIWNWLQNEAKSKNVKLEDATMSTGLIAVQGPKAVAAMAGLFADDVSSLKYYYAKQTRYQNQPCIVSRTGYTGEDGYEVALPNNLLTGFWNTLIERGALPCGLGARDTLRLEAAMPLYGHEMNENTDPITAGLGWAVKLEKGDFIGRDAISKVKPTLARVGLKLEGKRAAREQSPVVHNGQTIGTVTSGSYVPHLEQSIAMAYVSITPQVLQASLPPDSPMANSQIGTQLAVDLKGTIIPATVVPLPFYKKSK